MQRRYITVDVFTDRAFGGNPLAVVLDAGGLSTGQPPARFLFEEVAGLVPVDILKEDGKPVGAELTAPQPLKQLTSFGAEEAAACVSLSAGEIRTDRHAPQSVSVGMAFLVAELASRDALRRAKPEP